MLLTPIFHFISPYKGLEGALIRANTVVEKVQQKCMHLLTSIEKKLIGELCMYWLAEICGPEVCGPTRITL
jgi:hypothetical protein